MTDIMTKTGTEGDRAQVTAPNELLAEMMKRMEATPALVEFPERLPVAAIRELPVLFQPRGSKGIDERHVSDLARGIEMHGDLDPVLVMRIGGDTYLLDGHHRVAAYRFKKVREPIPVRHFHGTVEDAVLEAGKANSRAKLPMSTQGRLNYAWRLVRLGTYSKSQIVGASGASNGQVAVMRRVKKKLGEGADNHEHWWQAREAAQGKERRMMSGDEHEAFLTEMADSFADRLSKTFANKLSTNPEIAARALVAHFGRNAKALVVELQGLVGDTFEEDEEGDF
ncbi:ParB N-terminal domain-containing protein [Labrys sp. KB_33_2]|uniref:ParB/RepB/Spo0J family partition protein n=1 Tax=Labrys sp. KB_33_2 TaxID=3237479 RepID=UPI003F914148